jgi:hypothetical protein
MIPENATRILIQAAQAQALSITGGGFEKKLNDLQSYGTTAATSAATFAISHIPLAGPVVAQLVKLASDAGIDKAYEKLLADSKTPAERINNSLFLLERSLIASIRQAYNTLTLYTSKAERAEQECKDCQDAAREAKSAFVAKDCVDDLKGGCKVLEQLAKDLQFEMGVIKGKVDERVNNLASRIDNFRENHKNDFCMGPQKCYWQKPPPTPKFAGTKKPPIPQKGGGALELHQDL